MNKDNRCNMVLISNGLPNPRTCQVCGLGPCRWPEKPTPTSDEETIRAAIKNRISSITHKPLVDEGEIFILGFYEALSLIPGGIPAAAALLRGESEIVPIVKMGMCSKCGYIHNLVKPCIA